MKRRKANRSLKRSVKLDEEGVIHGLQHSVLREDVLKGLIVHQA